jgi:hypothetical protein
MDGTFLLQLAIFVCLDVSNWARNLMSRQSLTLDDLLDALQFLSSNGSGFAIEDWKAIASDALAGSAPAQYLVAAAFERLGDFSQARDWFARSAAQQYSLALSRLVDLQSASAA